MIKKLMTLAAGALTALAFAALPAGASAAEMEAHCSFAQCYASVEGTGNAVLSDDSGLSITCAKTTGAVNQTAATSTTVSVVLTFEGCNLSCQNQGAGTGKIVTNTLTGHLITGFTGIPSAAGILLTGFNVTFSCVILRFPAKKTVTGNVIGTFEFSSFMCNHAEYDHTVEFAQVGSGQQADKIYTGFTYDLLSNGTTASLTGTAHIRQKFTETVTITC